jgi:hypothetical protein
MTLRIAHYGSGQIRICPVCHQEVVKRTPYERHCHKTYHLECIDKIRVGDS